MLSMSGAWNVSKNACLRFVAPPIPLSTSILRLVLAPLTKPSVFPSERR